MAESLPCPRCGMKVLPTRWVADDQPMAMGCYWCGWPGPVPEWAEWRVAAYRTARDAE